MPSRPITDFPHSSTEMSERVRHHPWEQTPLGPIDSWPQSLRMAVDMMLVSKFPKCLTWGPELITLYNDAFKPILGAKPEALGRSFRDVWAETWVSLEPIAARALAGEATFIENYRISTDRNGRFEDAWFTFCYSPVRDEHGRVLGMLDTVVETTSSVVNAQRLEGMAAQLERQVAQRTDDRNRLWQLSTDIMLVMRPNLIITAVNPAWSDVLGWSEGELVGTSFFDWVHPEDQPRIQAAVALLAQDQPQRDMDCRLKHKHGGLRWISWAAVPGDGFFNAVGRDVTLDRERAAALEQAEELLRHSQKMEAVGQLTGGLAHDFNNLLTGITGSLELMRQRLGENRLDQLERYIHAAQGAAARAATLTHRLLAFSRRQPLDARPIAIQPLIEGLDELVAQALPPNIAYSHRAEPGLWSVLADYNQLESALLNLCINARDAMPDGGTLEVVACNHHHTGEPAALDLPPGDYVVFSVQDSGSGMLPHVAAKAFDPFFTTKPIGQGTGLGLSMVYGFARQSGGQVDIDSQVARGTRVRIFLPRHCGVSQLPAPAKTAHTELRRGNGQKIMVIDDQPLLRSMIGELLGGLGYEVALAADGEEGLKLMAEMGRLDLLVTDIGLPGALNGRQVARITRDAWPKLPILFITGYDQSDQSSPLQPGMDLLTKPFVLDDLAQLIQHILERARPGSRAPGQPVLP